MGIYKRGRRLSWDFTAEVSLEPEDLPVHVRQALAASAPFDEIEVSCSVTGSDDPGIPTGRPEPCSPRRGTRSGSSQGSRCTRRTAPGGKWTR
jgi:hypothetical protein